VVEKIEAHKNRAVSCLKHRSGGGNSVVVTTLSFNAVDQSDVRGGPSFIWRLHEDLIFYILR